ncbi:hypothetical protein M409DRAFT_35189 [Zasmidium cellare ATCC 36951]|uniref:NADP-dependent oxidoreductase domain-containing protein n=1 Tax=Zasmidium cellare ATCC 36951 TaxID=1080233 RepID=A0A6A6D8R2_ZASCE|nr:uncharacterized protein M409DRAFT_35189 [Zasmidium cellare ATCC 36951]KAF2174036.1 hypothetical protein M409DRAFT_35189 [Zasmidium cellare ATCC 36951]
MSPTAPSQIAGKAIGPVGYGLMGFTTWHGTPFEEAIEVMKAALESGSNFWNAGTFYGPPDRNSLHLLRAYFEKYPQDADRIVLSLKGAYDGSTHTPNCSPEGIRASVEESLHILNNLKTIDLFECARVDPKTPLETSIQTLASLIQEGKIGAYGLSEVSARTIRKAHAVHPVSAVEIELSLFSRHALENGTIQTCHELNIPVVGYSPLDRGWLTGQLKKPSDLPKDDYRHHMPRFQPGAFEKNVQLAEKLEGIAGRKGVTATQVAIGWVVRQGVVPIPGSTTVARVRENARPAELSAEELEEIWGLLEGFEVQGERYPEGLRGHLNG